MNVIEIFSPEDPRTEAYFHASDALLRAKQRPEEAMLVTEGPKVTLTALEKGLTPVSLLMRKKSIPGPGRAIIEACPEGTPVYTAEDGVLEALTGFRLQRSWVLGAMKRPRPRTAEELLAGARRAAVLEGIGEPSNVGAIYRSAAALGVDCLLLSPDCCDPYHRRSIRVCMGAVFTVPWARTGPDSGQALLHRMGFRTAGLALTDRSIPLDDPSPARQERLAVYLGTEDTGLKRETLEKCDYVVRIPMRPGIDSLNVAAAAAVAFWQLRPADLQAEAKNGHFPPPGQESGGALSNG